MDPDKPTETDGDLRDRFAGLREAEAPFLPGFRETLALAHARSASESRPWRWSAVLAPACAAVGVAILPFLWIRKAHETPSASLTTLPVLFTQDHGGSRWLDETRPAGAPLPSDALLPLHLRIRL